MLSIYLLFSSLIRWLGLSLDILLPLDAKQIGHQGTWGQIHLDKLLESIALLLFGELVFTLTVHEHALHLLLRVGWAVMHLRVFILVRYPASVYDNPMEVPIRLVYFGIQGRYALIGPITIPSA